MSTIRTRVLVADGEKFISLKDFNTAVFDDDFVMECAKLMKVGRDKGEPPLVCLRMAIAWALFKVSGDLEDALKKFDN